MFNKFQNYEETEKSVTIIAAIVCKGAIVFASDSQTTYEVAKDLYSKKIFRIEFDYGDALIARSGGLELSDLALQNLNRDCRTAKVEEAITPALIVQNVVRKIREDRQSTYGGATAFSLSEWDFKWSENNFTLTLAYQYEGEPYLYSVDLQTATAIPATSHYYANGIGKDLARYLLKELSSPKMEPYDAMSVAVYVVEKVKENVQGCSGPTQAGILWVVSKEALDDLRKRIKKPKAYTAQIVGYDEILRITNRLKALESESSKAWRTTVSDIVKQVRAETMAAINQKISR